MYSFISKCNPVPRVFFSKKMGRARKALAGHMTQKTPRNCGCNKLAWLFLDSEQSIGTGYLEKNLSWWGLLNGPHFEYEIQFHNVHIQITSIVTLQPANQKKESTSQCQGLFPPFPIFLGKKPWEWGCSIHKNARIEYKYNDIILMLVTGDLKQDNSAIIVWC